MPDQFTYTLKDIEAEVQRRAAEKEKEASGSSMPFPGPPAEGGVEAAKNLIAGYPERVGSAMEESKQEVVAALQDSAKGIQFPGETTIQLLGKGVAKPIMDVTGETITTGIGAAADAFNPKLRQGFNDLMEGIMNSDAAKAAIGYYQTVPENTRRTLESVFNLGNLLSPVKLKPTIAGDTVKGAIKKSVLEGDMGTLKVVSKADELKRKMLERFFQPVRSEENIANELKFGRGQVDRMVDDLMEVKGLSPVKTPEANIAALKSHMDKVEDKMQGSLKEFDRTGVMRDVKKSFGDLLRNTLDNDPILRAEGLTAAEKTATYNAVMRKVDGVVINLKEAGVNPNSLQGLLKLRRELDDVLNRVKGNLSREELKELSLEKQVVMNMRGKINEAISGFVEQTGKADETITDLLKKQSSMYRAQGNYIQRSSKQIADMSKSGWFMRALSAHPILVYRAMQNTGTSPALAAVLALPSAVNYAGETVGAARRAMASPMSPAVRAGMFYGGEEEQQ
jgi:hypothetical protein